MKKSQTHNEIKAIQKIYESYEKRKAQNKVKFDVLLNDGVFVLKKWYEFWK